MDLQSIEWSRISLGSKGNPFPPCYVSFQPEEAFPTGVNCLFPANPVHSMQTAYLCPGVDPRHWKKDV
jgi:hypothetical protein